MMKKIFLLLCLVLVSLVVDAASPFDTKEKVIKRAKAIAAFHVIHNKGGEFQNNKEATNAKSVDALEKLIKSDPKIDFEEICDDIKDYKVDEKDTSSLIKSFEILLRKYKVSDKGALEQIKVPIKNSGLFINEGTSNTTVTHEAEDSEGEGDVDNSTGMVSHNSHNEKESSGTIIVQKEDKSNVSKDKREKTDELPSLLPIVIISLALLGSLFCCFQLWLKNKKHKKDLLNIHESFKKIAERANNSYIANSSSPKEFAEKLNAVINKIVENEKSSLEDEINNLKKRIKELEDSEKFAKKNNSYYKPNSTTDRGISHGYVGSHETKSEESHSPTVIWDNIQSENHENSIREQEAIVERVDPLKGKEMFLYLPNDNMFKDGSEEYRYGKTLYKMVYTSEETADFEFINKPETLAFAKQSRSRFLEGACFIENDDAISFNTIQTLEKGKLTKADEGWNIISKARIRLS